MSPWAGTGRPGSVHRPMHASTQDRRSRPKTPMDAMRAVAMARNLPKPGTDLAGSRAARTGAWCRAPGAGDGKESVTLFDYSGTMDTNTALAALSALAQPHRLAVFRWLVERSPDGAFAGEIAEHLGLPGTTLSFHLKALQQGGLIQPEPQGRHIRYRADLDAVRGLLGYLTDNCCGGNASLCEPVAGRSGGC